MRSSPGTATRYQSGRRSGLLQALGSQTPWPETHLPRHSSAFIPSFKKRSTGCSGRSSVKSRWKRSTRSSTAAGDLIIAARTAAGKTEAAFLPILSRMLAEPATGVRAIYVGPLKALINDQFSRLEELCHEAEIPVHKWHGDVSSAPKRRLLEQPSGVLLITPESIESLFRQPSASTWQRSSRTLAFIVIDELHSFIGTERGAHLRSLICRLAAKSREPVRRVGLSATFGAEIEGVRRWLRPSEPEAVRVIEDPEKKAIQLRIFGFLRPLRPRAPKAESDDDTASPWAISSWTFSRRSTERPP